MGNDNPETRWDKTENKQTVLKSQKQVTLSIDKKNPQKTAGMSKPPAEIPWKHAVSCEILPDCLEAFQNSVKQVFK